MTTAARNLALVCGTRAPRGPRKTVLASHLHFWTAIGWAEVAHHTNKVEIEWLGEGEPPTPGRSPRSRYG